MTQDTSGAQLRIQIGNLPIAATEADVRAMFLPHGPVQFFDRPLNEHTHRPGPLAFVEMPSVAAAAAIKALKGARIAGKVVTVVAAAPVAAWAPSSSRVPHSSLPRRTVTPRTEHEDNRAVGS